MYLQQALPPRCGGRRLLLVLDQFEEFVILHAGATDRAPFAAFVRDLAANPIPRLTLLLVVRSDYIPLVHTLDLPAMQERATWFDVAPFTLAAARRIMRYSMLNLTPERIEGALAEVNNIDDTPGLIRPIIINMMGLVLARFGGGAPKGVHGRTLLTGYLRQTLASPELVGLGPPLMRAMITDNGTKRPISVEALAEILNTERSYIREALNLLARHGIARLLDPINNIWEISHDFVARLIAQILPSIRLRLLWRARTALTWSAIAIWIATAAGAFPVWEAWKERQARAMLAAHGISIAGTPGEGFALKADAGSQPLSPTEWQVVFAYVRPVKTLEFSATNWSQLPDLGGLSVRQLTIANNKNLRALRRLTGLPLEQLNITGDVETLPDLDGLPLKQLGIVEDYSLRGLPNLSSLTGLTVLTLVHDQSLRSIPELVGLPLESITIIDTNITVLPNLTDLPLTRLWIEENGFLKALPDLSSLTKLKQLAIITNAWLEVLPSLPDIPGLVHNASSVCAGVPPTSLSYLRGAACPR
jgi:hypothetical protein